MTRESELIKIILLGDKSVGKTSLLKRFATGNFELTEPTIGLGIECVNVAIDGFEIVLAFHDTGGEERFKCMTPNFYRRTDGVILIYDVTDINTFNSLEKWLQDIRTYCEDVPILIVGNKTDCPEKKRVNISQVRRYAENENIEFMEASAYGDINVKEAFFHIVRLILHRDGLIENINDISIKILPKNNSTEQEFPENSFTDDNKPRKISSEFISYMDKKLFLKGFNPEQYIRSRKNTEDNIKLETTTQNIQKKESNNSICSGYCFL